MKLTKENFNRIISDLTELTVSDKFIWAYNDEEDGWSHSGDSFEFLLTTWDNRLTIRFPDKSVIMGETSESPNTKVDFDKAKFDGLVCEIWNQDNRNKAITETNKMKEIETYFEELKTR